MAALLVLVAVIAIPIFEIWFAVWLAGVIGWGWVVVLAAAAFGFGLAMTMRAGQSWSRSVSRAQEDPAFRNDGFPRAMGDAGLLFAGGILLIIPGVVTALLGLLLVFPPTRGLVSRLFRGRVETMARDRGYRRVTIIDGETVERPAGPTAAPGTSTTTGGDAPRVIIGEIVGPEEPGPNGSGPGSS